jgi:hypothetical protein
MTETDFFAEGFHEVLTDGSKLLPDFGDGSYADLMWWKHVLLDQRQFVAIEWGSKPDSDAGRFAFADPDQQRHSNQSR